MNQFIVLSGEAGAGKDSVAKILEERHDFKMFSLSTKMKKFCADVFGFTDDQLYGPSHFRNEPDKAWERPCSKCYGTGYFVTEVAYAEIKTACYFCDGRGKCNDNSPRRILQLLGDEWGRQMIHPDIWTMAARKDLEAWLAFGTKIVINDARFENDRTNLAKWFGAKRVDVRTERKRSTQNAAWRQHGSENDRPLDKDVEYVLFNNEDYPFPSLPSIVDTMLKSLYPDTYGGEKGASTG